MGTEPHSRRPSFENRKRSVVVTIRFNSNGGFLDACLLRAMDIKAERSTTKDKYNGTANRIRMAKNRKTRYVQRSWGLNFFRLPTLPSWEVPTTQTMNFTLKTKESS